MPPIPCPRCEGHGELRHPRWGQQDCPEPTIPCPECGGTGGWDPQDRADELATEALDDWRHGLDDWPVAG